MSQGADIAVRRCTEIGRRRPFPRAWPRPVRVQAWLAMERDLRQETRRLHPAALFEAGGLGAIQVP